MGDCAECTKCAKIDEGAEVLGTGGTRTGCWFPPLDSADEPCYNASMPIYEQGICEFEFCTNNQMRNGLDDSGRKLWKRWCHTHAGARNNVPADKVSEGKRRRKRCFEIRDEVINLLKTETCQMCGTADHRVLTFDHLDSSQKTDGVMRLVNRWKSREKVFAEIAKCRVLCANCHMIHTGNQTSSRRNFL